jgi:integrase
MTDERKPGEWQKPKADRGVFRRGRVWYVRFSDEHGKLRAERAGFTKAEALTKYRNRKEEVSDGRFFPERAKRAMLFDEIVKDTVAVSRARFELTYPGQKFKPGRYDIIAEWFEGRKAASITPAEIRARLDERCKTPATFNRFRVALSHVFKIAIDNRKATENPVTSVKLLPENNERVRYLNQRQKENEKESEEERLRKAIRASSQSQRESELDLALNTGMRQGEQYKLRWENVDLKRAQITIPRAKSGRREYIPINAEANAALRKLRALAPKSELVCPFGCGHRHRNWWEGVLKAAKIEDFHWHDLRHTFASRLVMAGNDIFTVNRLMRHKTIQMTMRYAHLSSEHLQEAVETLMKPQKVLQKSDTPAVEQTQMVQ